MTADRYRLSHWGDEVLKLNSGDGCITLNILKKTLSRTSVAR